MGRYEDSDIWDVEEDEVEDAVKFRDEVTECPNCKKTVSEDMDSCLFCGDILFRYLKDGTFIPPRGPMTKIVAGIIILIILLGVLAFVLGVLGAF